MNSEAPSRIILRASRLIDGTGAAPVDDPMLVIENGRIEAVCRGNLPAHLAQGALLVGLPGMALLPGLIDSHVHLVFEPASDHATTRRRLAEEPDSHSQMVALGHAQEMLRAGVTTVRDCGDRGFVTVAVRRAIDEGRVAGPRLLCSGPPITTTAGHLHWCGNEADTADEVKRAVRTAVKRGADFIKIMATGGNMTPGSNPRRAQYHPAELKAAVFEAHRLGKRVAAHVHSVEGIAAALEAGVDTFEHCSWSPTEPGQAYDFRPELAREMVRRGVWWGHTSSGIRWRTHPDPATQEEQQAAQIQQLRAGRERFRRTLDAGVRMMISSDSGARPTPFGAFVDALEGAVVGLGLTPLAVIEACTRVAAEGLGLESEVGTLVPGRRADVLVVAGDPSTDIGALRRVALVLRDGKIVHRTGAEEFVQSGE
ncbi:MAG: amidohydrolase family protein [Armatimonadetes bacterium]|nr:amidohydrolase family protein [Armatimonadota bacterium]